MSRYAEKMTGFLLEYLLITIAVIVMAVSDTAFASEGTKLDGPLATMGNSSIQCEVLAHVKTREAFIACKFPIDISANNDGFFVQADRDEKDDSTLITACHWKNTPTASLWCLGRDNREIKGNYVKITNTATVSIPHDFARSYNLSCHISGFTFQSRPCCLLDSNNPDLISWNLYSPLLAVLVVEGVLLLVSACINVLFVTKHCFKRNKGRATKTCCRQWMPALYHADDERYPMSQEQNNLLIDVGCQTDEVRRQLLRRKFKGEEGSHNAGGTKVELTRFLSLESSDSDYSTLDSRRRPFGEAALAPEQTAPRLQCARWTLKEAWTNTETNPVRHEWGKQKAAFRKAHRSYLTEIEDD